MSKLNDLINKLCPDGVEFVKLGETCEVLRGKRLTKKQLSETEKYPVFHGGIQPIGFYSKKNRNANTVMIINVGASAGTIGYSEKDFWSSDGCYCLSHTESVLPRYIYYVLSKDQHYFQSKVRHGGIPTLDALVVRNYRIPLPPLPIQAEIVRILDKFTQLEAELEAELDCRKRQYEFYRDQLLSFDKITPPERNNVVWKKLSEVGTFIRGKRFVRTDIVEHGVPCIHYGDIYTYYGLTAQRTRTFLMPEKAAKMRFAQKNDVIIVVAGENNMDIGVGVAWIGDEKVAVHDACFIFRSDLHPRYLSHYLRGNDYHIQIKKYVSEGKICSISAQNLGKAVIAIPQLKEQERIANILDRFESLTTSLQHGLPAEIAARRQQYEYYRDKLLDFKRKTA